MAADVSPFWFPIFVTILSTYFICAQSTKNLTVTTAEEFTEKFRAELRNGSRGQLNFPTVTPYRDKYCYRRVVERDTKIDVRIGVCMRAAIKNGNVVTGYVFVTKDGIYASAMVTKDYVEVASSGGGESSLSNVYIHNQLNVKRRVFLCDRDVPDNITLPTGVITPVSETLNTCDTVCIALRTLSRYPHIRVSKPVLERVLCYETLCLTLNHRVYSHGCWQTMSQFCATHSCRIDYVPVAKALIQTQSAHGVRFGLVYGASAIEFRFTWLLQHVVDLLCHSFYVFRDGPFTDKGRRSVPGQTCAQSCAIVTVHSEAVGSSHIRLESV